MWLVTEGQFRGADATKQNIQEAFSNSALRGEFIILSRNDEV